MKVAIYVRVSTADQNQEVQLRELQDYATRHQWEIAHVYQDTISGASASHRGLNQLSWTTRGARKLDILCLEAGQVRAITARLPWLTFGRFIATTQALDTDN